MSFLKNFLGMGKIDLKSLIKEKLDGGELIQHRLPFVDNLMISFEFNFYKTDQLNKLFWVKSINKLNIKPTHIGYNLIVIFEGKIITTIVFDWIGLKELVNIFESCQLFNSNDNFNRKLFLLKYDINAYLKHLSRNYKEVIDVFKDLVIRNDTIDIYRTIKPDKAYINENKIVRIPEDESIPITKVTIYTDPSGLVSSVKVKGKHPNADKKGWFCLGNLKMVPFCVGSINNLIEQIKCYKLDDCYWKPNGYKKWI